MAEDPAWPPKPIAVSVAEAARLIGISTSHAYALNARGELPGAYRAGRRILVHLDTFRMAMKAEATATLARTP